MKIKKSELKKIIKEELEANQPVQEGLENINPENLEVVMKAVEHFATQPAVMSALAAGGLVAALAKIRELMSGGKLEEMNIPDLDDDGGKYRYAKSMFYSNLARVLDDFVKESGGKFDKSMALRIKRGVAGVLGDRKK
jgi:hypothetical protein|tara:strand:+ start:506 stop:919 length:414 start_codon:yes stop_codon:yes gene_type:complete